MMDIALIAEYWWIFPVSICFATIAIGSGVSGALFFSPFFIYVVGLEPAQAIGAGLMTEVFGMGNGLRSYVQQKIVDYRTAGWLLLGSVPAIILGAMFSSAIDPELLKIIFGTGLIVLAGFLVFFPSPNDCEPGERESELERQKSGENEKTVIEAADGEVFEYPTCWRPPGVGLASAGGLITGMISAGLPEIVTSQLVLRCRVPARVAVATSIFVLAITAGVGSVVHMAHAKPVWYVVVWSIPGVLIGSTIGGRVGKYLPEELMETALGILFGVIGAGVVALEVL
jgi:uncharacterized membrane protein YfcA